MICLWDTSRQMQIDGMEVERWREKNKLTSTGKKKNSTSLHKQGQTSMFIPSHSRIISYGFVYSGLNVSNYGDSTISFESLLCSLMLLIPWKLSLIRVSAAFLSSITLFSYILFTLLLSPLQLPWCFCLSNHHVQLFGPSLAVASQTEKALL